MNLAEASKALVNDGGLPNAQFTEVSLSDKNATEALGTSGAIVYTRLPVYNNVDLETFCPGGKSTVFITSDSDQEKPDVSAATNAPEEDSHDHEDGEDHDSHDHDHDHDDEDHDDSSATASSLLLSVLATVMVAIATTTM